MTDAALSRRALIGGVGLIGGISGLGAISARAGAGTDEGNGSHHSSHDAHGTVGQVDHARNGFDPHAILTDFDGGEVSRDVRAAPCASTSSSPSPKEIEVAPGVFFPAWTYNGRVPGPTIRATEGDRMRITLVNGSPHPHTIHFHGIPLAPRWTACPAPARSHPGEDLHLRLHRRAVRHPPVPLPLAAAGAATSHRGLYGAFIVDPPGGRPPAHEMVLVLNGFDTNFDGENEVYAANTVAFAYADEPDPASRAGRAAAGARRSTSPSSTR